uniref:Putative conserved secreted protein n=1 Tax=Lutzomyia longipalpis TaxID=7200 RepID=A0A1B0CLG0_LUTLO
MNFMIIAILLIGAASMSSQKPIVDNTADEIVLLNPEEASDDLDVAENNIIMPYFRKAFRHRRRQIREATPEQFAAELPQIPEEEASDDLEPAENNIIMPYFRKAFRHRGRLIRQATPEDYVAELPQIPQEEDEASDDLEPAENHIFMPYFRYRERKAFRRRARQAAAESFVSHRRSTRSVDSDISGGDDDLAVAENHIFLPVFRYKSRAAYRQRVKKPVKNNRG